MIKFLIVNISKNNSWPNLFSAIGQLLIFLLIFSIIIIFSIYITKFIASTKLLKFKNKNMKILETLPVGYQNYIQILKIYDKYILVGISKNNITFLLDLTEDYKNIENIDEKNTNFKYYIDKFFKIKRNNNGDIHD